VLAAGAIERPLAFANNDRPGVMSADAALRHLALYAAAPGRRIAVATTSDSGLPRRRGAGRGGLRRDDARRPRATALQCAQPR
jgi:sarcosine oxidase subunit alpha